MRELINNSYQSRSLAVLKNGKINLDGIREDPVTVAKREKDLLKGFRHKAFRLADAEKELL